jgi:hypothetical protein
MRTNIIFLNKVIQVSVKDKPDCIKTLADSIQAVHMHQYLSQVVYEIAPWLKSVQKHLKIDLVPILVAQPDDPRPNDDVFVDEDEFTSIAADEPAQFELVLHVM